MSFTENPTSSVPLDFTAWSGHSQKRPPNSGSRGTGVLASGKQTGKGTEEMVPTHLVLDI